MLEIDDYNITLTRGDSAKIVIWAKKDEDSPELYIFQPGDVVKFTVKESTDSTTELIAKQVTVTEECMSVNIILQPNNTKTLPFGKYVYDVQLTTAGGWVDTFISKKTFKVGEEVG